jgi:hypothetical protein
MKKIYPEEKGRITINGHPMEWVMRRSKGESCFGIRGSRIFSLQIWKDRGLTLEYGRGYTRQPEKEDEETHLCLNYLLDKFGKNKKKEKKS